MGIFHKEYLSEDSYYSCKQCGTHITSPSLIISKVLLLLFIIFVSFHFVSLFMELQAEHTYLTKCK